MFLLYGFLIRSIFNQKFVVLRKKWHLEFAFDSDAQKKHYHFVYSFIANNGSWKLDKTYSFHSFRDFRHWKFYSHDSEQLHLRVPLTTLKIIPIFAQDFEHVHSRVCTTALTILQLTISEVLFELFHLLVGQ